MLIVREALLQKDEKKRLGSAQKVVQRQTSSVYSEEDKGLLYFIAEEGLNISFLEELLSSDQLKQKTAMYWSPIKEKLKKKK